MVMSTIVKLPTNFIWKYDKYCTSKQNIKGWHGFVTELQEVKKMCQHFSEMGNMKINNVMKHTQHLELGLSKNMGKGGFLRE